jgi:predicted dehydrogenase
MAQNLKAVLVGCGAISRIWLDTAQEMADLQIVGLVDLDEEAARQRAGEYDLSSALVSRDLAAALGETCPDVVFDCTVPEAHVDVTLEALWHGCHVLGEKPLADTLDNARRMVAAALGAGRLYAVMQNRRFDPNIRRLRRFLESGAIGRITTVHSDFYLGAHIGGFRQHMRHVLLLDMAIHTFDAARYITGADASAVYCHEWNPSGSWYDHDASAVATFEMSDGVVYTYRGSWCAEGLRTPWESAWRIIGERGSVTWDGGQGFEAQVAGQADGLLAELHDVEIPLYDDPIAGGVARVGGHGGLIREFLHAVRSGEVPETICTDNIKSLAMVFGAVKSAESEAKVAVEW